MNDWAGFGKLNPGLPRRFLDAEAAQDWLPFGATDEQIARAQRGDTNTYLEWAHWYNDWEAKGHDV